MAKALFVYNKSSAPISEEKLAKACINVSPDNIEALQYVRVHGCIGVGVLGSGRRFEFDELSGSLVLGTRLHGPDDDVADPSYHPDGTYFMCHNTGEHLYIFGDPLGTRTVWIYEDADRILASTSQLMIISYLNSFCLSQEAVAWFLVTGTIGEGSWDDRLRRLAPYEKMCFDKSKQKTRVFKTPPPTTVLTKDPVDGLRSAIQKSIKLTYDTIKESTWHLPLSGGQDSRGILCLWPDREIETITWGTKRSRRSRGSDAHIASKLAAVLGVKNRFFQIDPSRQETFDQVISRYLKCSEGRIDHITGYMDGLEVWKLLHDNNVQGTIRGDEAFGWVSVGSEEAARESIGLPRNASTLIHGDRKLDLPSDHFIRPNENIAAYRDRLYREFRIPIVIAALSDIKFSYVEQISPFLSKEIVEYVKQMPDSERTDKRCFRKVVEAVSPRVPYSSHGSNLSLHQIVSITENMNTMVREICRLNEDSLFPESMVAGLAEGARKKSLPGVGRLKKQAKRVAASIMPSSLKGLIRTHTGAGRPESSLLLRVYLVLKTRELFTKCASASGRSE